MRLCLVSSDAAVEQTVRQNCPPQISISYFSTDTLVDRQERLTTQGQQALRAAAASEAVLITWCTHRAPAIRTLCGYLHRTLPVPLLAVCAGGPEDEVAALQAGIDETLTHLHLPLVQAKAEALRRVRSHAFSPRPHPLTAPALAFSSATTTPQPFPSDLMANVPEHDIRQLGVLTLNRTEHQLYVRDEPVELTAREYELLDYLMDNVNTALTRDDILTHVWGINFDTGTNMVDVYMHFLRRKLKEHGVGNVIQTVRRYGYRLAVPD
jgi:DNA-binding response OmpR family regulator